MFHVEERFYSIDTEIAGGVEIRVFQLVLTMDCSICRLLFTNCRFVDHAEYEIIGS